MPDYNPNTIHSSLAGSLATSSGPTLRGVERWLDSPTAPINRNSRRIYKLSIRRVAKLMRKRLEEIPADIDKLLKEFSLETFHRGYWTSVKAMLAFRRNISAAINRATGVISQSQR